VHISLEAKQYLVNAKQRQDERKLGRERGSAAGRWGAGLWPLHGIAITNVVWCMAYKRGVGGGSYIAQWSCNRIAIE